MNDADRQRWAAAVLTRLDGLEAKAYQLDNLQGKYHELMKDNTTLASEIASLKGSLESFTKSLSEVTYLLLKHERRIDAVDRIAFLPAETTPPANLGVHNEEARPEHDPQGGDAAGGTVDGGTGRRGDEAAEGRDGETGGDGSGGRAGPAPAGTDGPGENAGMQPQHGVSPDQDVQPRLAAAATGNVAGGGANGG